MARMSEVIEGLCILKELAGDQQTAAEHDIIYAAEIEPEDVPPEKLKRLEKLGWWHDEELNCWCRFT